MSLITNHFRDFASSVYHPMTRCHLSHPIKDFQIHLLSFAKGSISANACIVKCLDEVKKTFVEQEMVFSEMGRESMKSYVEIFSQIVDDNVSPCETDYLKKEFKNSFWCMVKDLWTKAIARSFYTISSISDKNEQMTAAKKWTDQYFSTCNYLNEEKTFFALSETFIEELKEKTISNFYEYIREITSTKIDQIFLEMQRDPDSFQRRVNCILTKASEDPTTLSNPEREYLEYLSIFKDQALYNLSIEEKITLLKTYVGEYEVQAIDISILDSPSFFEIDLSNE